MGVARGFSIGFFSRRLVRKVESDGKPFVLAKSEQSIDFDLTTCSESWILRPLARVEKNRFGRFFLPYSLFLSPLEGERSGGRAVERVGR